MSGLAAALQAAKLRKTQSSTSTSATTDVNGGGSSSSSSSGYGSIGKGRDERPALSGMTSMMDEMQKTLARRRAKVDREVTPND